ncbi:MAG: glycosyltransferase family 4 protein [Sulfolobales archaeon]
MRVAVVDDAGMGVMGGKGVFGKELYSYLLSVAYEILGHQVVRVILGSGTSEFNDAIRLQGTSIPVLRAFYDRGLTVSLNKLLMKMDIDLVHVNILNPRYVNTIISTVKSRAMLFLTMHSYSYVCPTGWKVKFPQTIPCNTTPPSSACIRCMYSMHRNFQIPITRLLKGLYQQCALKKLLDESDIVISPSRLLARKVKEEIGGKHVLHIPNPLPRDFAIEVPMKPRENAALFIGRLEYEKGAHLLPEVAKLMKPVRLYVVGGGRLAKYIKENSPENLVFRGYVTLEEKRELLNKVSVVVVPSIYCDTYPTVVLEAFATGRPIVAFDLGGPKELIEDTGGGLVVKPYDIEDFAIKARALAEDLNKSYEMGLRGRNYITSENSIEIYATRLQKVIESII